MKTINRDDPRTSEDVSRYRNSPPIQLGLLQVILLSLVLLPLTHCLIDDPVCQRRILKQYQPSLMYEHTFFDMSILDAQSLVQADHSATYFLAK